jgi:YXWGXW repeat-containing protein
LFIFVSSRLPGIVLRTTAGARAASTALLLVACSGHLPHPPYAAQTTAALVEAPFPPPPPHPELVPRQPGPTSVWIDGEWTWRGRKWAWKAGRWVVPPPGAVFCPWTAVRNAAGTLFFAAGTWRDAQGNMIAEPLPLAVGTTGSAETTEDEEERGAGGGS